MLLCIRLEEALFPDPNEESSEEEFVDSTDRSSEDGGGADDTSALSFACSVGCCMSDRPRVRIDFYILHDSRVLIGKRNRNRCAKLSSPPSESNEIVF